MAWNVLCPGCGGVLDTSATLKTVNRDQYHCSLCAAGYEPTLDEMVEVTFTVSPRVRRIAAHDPDRLPRSSITGRYSSVPAWTCPRTWRRRFSRAILEMIELGPGEKAFLSLQLPPEFVIIFDAVTHSTQFIDVQGEPTHERQNLSMVISRGHAPNETLTLRPGPLRLTLENHTDVRVLPNVCIAGGRPARHPGAPSAVPDGQAPAHQPDVPRHLPHRHPRHRSAAEDHQPDIPVH